MMSDKLPTFEVFVKEDITDNSDTITIKLHKKWVMYLVQFPETGMGYQRVDVEFTDGTKINNVVVRNGEFLVLPKTATGKRIVNIALHGSDRSETAIQKDVPIGPGLGGMVKEPTNRGGQNVTDNPAPTPRG